MFMAKRYHRFLLLARQFGLLLNKGNTQEQALSTIEHVLEPDSPELKQLKQLLSSHSTDDMPWMGGPGRTLARLLSAASAAGADKLVVFKSFYQRLLRFDEYQYIKNFDVSSVLFYFAMVMSTLVLVTGIYVIYVLPGFETLFVGAGAALPKLTIYVMTITRNFGVPLLLLVLLLVGYLGYIIRTSKINLQTFRFFSRTITWFPGVKRIALAFNDYLVLNFLSVLLEAGVPEEQARQEINNLLRKDSAKTTLAYTNNQAGEMLDDAIIFASRLGNLQEEVAEQIVLKRETILQDYTEFKDKIGTVALVIAAIFVGTVVVAMYLPIFQMGKVVGG